MRTELKRFRVSNFFTQEQMAEKGGVSRNCYAAIEQGNRAGSADFWFNIQAEFNLPIDKLNEMRNVREVKQ